MLEDHLTTGSNLSEAELINLAKSSGIQRFVVGGIIEQSGKILFLKRASHDFMGGIYELPSGKVESNETLEGALIREVKEETGLDVASKKYVNFFDYSSKNGKLTRQFNYHVVVKYPCEVKISEEHENFTWGDFDKMEELNITPAVKNVCTKFRKEVTKI